MLEKIPPRERELVDFLYRAGEATVADLRNHLPDAPSASALRTMLSRLEAKGLVRRRQAQEGWLYSPTVPQDAASVIEWRARTRELFPSLDSVDDRGRKIPLDSPELLGTPRVLELARKYGASHVIARSSPPLDLPVLYATPVDPDADVSGYTIYETGVAPTAKTP